MAAASAVPDTKSTTSSAPSAPPQSAVVGVSSTQLDEELLATMRKRLQRQLESQPEDFRREVTQHQDSEKKKVQQCKDAIYIRAQIPILEYLRGHGRSFFGGIPTECEELGKEAGELLERIKNKKTESDLERALSGDAKSEEGFKELLDNINNFRQKLQGLLGNKEALKKIFYEAGVPDPDFQLSREEYHSVHRGLQHSDFESLNKNFRPIILSGMLTATDQKNLQSDEVVLSPAADDFLRVAGVRPPVIKSDWKSFASEQLSDSASLKGIYQSHLQVVDDHKKHLKSFRDLHERKDMPLARCDSSFTDWQLERIKKVRERFIAEQEKNATGVLQARLADLKEDEKGVLLVKPTVKIPEASVYAGDADCMFSHFAAEKKEEKVATTSTTTSTPAPVAPSS